MALKAQAAKVRKAYQHITVTDLTGGLDLWHSETLINERGAQTLTNWSLGEPGALKTRAGFAAFSSVALGSESLQGGARVYLNTAIPAAASTAFTVVAWNGGIYNVTDTGGWASTTAYSTGLNSTGMVDFPHDRDLVAVFDGSTTPRKSTNGSSWTQMGIGPSTASATLSTASTGGLSTSEFEVSFGYKDRDLAHYSNESSAVSTITPSTTGQGLVAVVPNSTDAQVDAVVLYARNKTAGESIRRKISSAVQSTGSNSTLTITSSNWTSNDEAPSDHNVPPTMSFGVVWKNRWWGRSATVKNRLHFTQIFQPQSWPTLFYIDIPFERGDEIRALVPMGDTLVIYGTTKAFLVFGQTSLDFEVRPTLDSQDGAFGPRAIAVVENGVLHGGNSGLYIFDGASDKLLTQPLEPGWRDLVQNASPANLNRLAIVYHQREKEVRVSVPRRYPSGTYGEWILDLNRTRQQEEVAWSASDRPIGGYLHWNGNESVTGNRGRLFSWHSTSARLFEEATGTTANSSNLVAEYEGPGLALGARRGRWIDLRGEYEPATGTFSVEASIDDVAQGSVTLPTAAGLSLYGTAVYGTASYAAAARRQFYTPLPLGADGRTIVVSAIYTGQAEFKVFNYTAGFVPETQARDYTE